MHAKALVTGEIVFDDNTPVFSNATVYVRLEDTSRMDATAPALAEQVIPSVSGSGGKTIPFALHGEKPADERARLNVSVHVSLSGGRAIQPGDYLTMESYPVLTHGYPDHVQVHVRQV